MSRPHYVRPDHHPLPFGNRQDGQHEPRLPKPRQSTAPAGLFAPAPEVIAAKAVKPKRSPSPRPSRATGESANLEHGTDYLYGKCRQRPEGACAECKEAHRLQTARYPRKRSTTVFVHEGCGTPVGIEKHRARREKQCDACRAYREGTAA
jgi:hypothetical protein